jgi:membrane-associated phospholipid phosphatase
LTAATDPVKKTPPRPAPQFVRKPRQRDHGAPPRRFWALMLGLGVVALASAMLVQAMPPKKDLFLAVNQWASRYPEAVWSALTLLGETPVLIAIVSPLLVWRPQAFYSVLAAVPVGACLSWALKALYNAPRPAALIDPALFQVIGPQLHRNAFPSGHTITVFAAAAALVVGLLAARRQKWQVPRMLAGLIVLLAAMVGVSRVAVGAHWPVDVLAGAGVGWIAGTCGAWITFRFPDLWQTPRISTLLSLAVGALGLWLLKAPVEFAQGHVTLYIAAACGILTVSDLVLRVGVER